MRGTPIPDDNKASRQANAMRQQSKHIVQLTKEEFTTSDPMMIYQPTNEAEEALKEEGLKNVRLEFGRMQSCSLGHFHEPMWAVLHLSKNDEDYAVF